MKNIVIFSSGFIPGYKGGGPIKSVQNIVKYLNAYFNVYVITKDRDLGDDEPYKDIKKDCWNDINGAKVYYLDCTKGITNYIKTIRKILKDIDVDLYYLNSIFQFRFSILINLLIKLNLINKGSILLAPRGELDNGALSIKKYKKIIFIKLSRIFNLYNSNSWHATSLEEEINIRSIYNGKVYVVPNISMIKNFKVNNEKIKDKLKIVFLSRISEKKNLLYAINLLEDISGEIIFDIYGTLEDKEYWAVCLDKINEIKSKNQSIEINYKGELKPDDVIYTLSKYDCFLFPTKGENFGHVIVEALNARIPLILSNNTPWNDIEESNLGWTIDLNNQLLFKEKIEKLLALDSLQWEKMLDNSLAYLNNKLEVEVITDKTKKMFNECIVK